MSLGVDVRVVLPTVVQTELSARVSAANGIKPVTADDVAKVIEAVIRKPKAGVGAPLDAGPDQDHYRDDVSSRRWAG